MTTNNIFIIDSRVADYQRLMAALPVGSEAFLLNPNQDGVEQMQAILSDYGDLDSIQIISHGAQGVLYLGNTVLNQGNIDSYRIQLGDIGSSLTASGDLLLYGCDVAQGDKGRQFIEQLALFTGADVAASDDLTGNAALGGDWKLEAVIGTIETAPQSLRYEGLLGLTGSPNTKAFPGFTLGEFVNFGAFAALKADGSVVTWGMANYGGDSSSVADALDGTKAVTQIYSAGHAFAALRVDGSVITWGTGSYGGDSSSVASKLDGTVDVTQIYSTVNAFAALRVDGSVVVWGWAGEGGDSSSVASKLDGAVPVTQIYSAHNAFAALRADGSVVTWGNASYGGDSSSVANNLDGTVDVKQIFIAGRAFAALRADGSVVTWGFASGGGDSTSVTNKLDGTVDVMQIYSTVTAFAALRVDGSVVTWGLAGEGGDSTSVSNKLDGTVDVTQIYSTVAAFAALRADGSVVTWGASSSGGDSSGVVSKLDGAVDVTQIYSTYGAFAALRADGSVVTWGLTSQGGDSSSIANKLDGTVGVTQIYSNSGAFAALRADGSVITWGDSASGGDSSSVASALVDVTQIFTTGIAFAALRVDGSVVTWGAADSGGDSSAVASQLSSGVVGLANIYTDDFYTADSVLEKPSEIVLEYFTKGLAYDSRLEDEDHWAEIELEPWWKDLGYQISEVFIDGTFLAVGLTGADKEPVLAIRGTTDFSDWETNFDTRGVGYLEFLSAWNNTGLGIKYGESLETWLKENPGSNITGHSQGGAQAQLLASITTAKAAIATTEDQKIKLGDVLTFNSPGISSEDADKFNPNPDYVGNVTHVVSSGDVVQLAGEAFIPGEIYRYNFEALEGGFIKGVNPFGLVLAAHTGHWSNLSMYLSPFRGDKDFTESYIANFGDVEISAYEHGNFSYLYSGGEMDYEYFYFLLGIAALNKIPSTLGLPPGEAMAFALMHRGTTEDLRANYGPGLYKLLSAPASLWDFILDKGDDLFEAISTVFGWGVDALEAVKNWTVATWEGIANWSAEVWQVARDWVAESWVAISHWTASTWENTKDWTAETWQKAKDWSAEVWAETVNDVASFFKDLEVKAADVINYLVAKSASISDSIKDIAVDTLESFRVIVGSSIGWESLSKSESVEVVVSEHGVATAMPETSTVFFGIGTSETFVGGGGADVYFGGGGSDTYYLGHTETSTKPVLRSLRSTESIDPFPEDEDSSQNILFQGSDIIAGTAADLDGDTVYGFANDDAIFVASEFFTQSDLFVSKGSAILQADVNQDGEKDFTLTLKGEYELDKFVVENQETGTVIRYTGYLGPILGDDEGEGFITDNKSPLVTIDVRNNDIAHDGGSIVITGFDDSQLTGLLTYLGGGQFSYDPSGAFDSLLRDEEAIETFTYTAKDATGLESQASVQIKIIGANTAPVANADNVVVDEDTILFSNVLGNDNDPDGDTLSVTPQSLITAAGAAVEMLANGNFNYIPAPNFNGADSFDYTLLDGLGESSAATVNILVNAVNDIPQAGDDYGSVNEDSKLTASFDDLMVNDIDVDGASKTIVGIDTSGTVGSVVIDTLNRTITYSADADAFDLLATGATAKDSFKYTLQGSSGETSVATVFMSVVGISDGVDIFGTVRSETLNGTAGDDRIRGNDGNDKLKGGDGNDWLAGERGSDTLTGGLGNDIFFFSKGAGGDVIADFANGIDKIQIAADTGITDFSQLKISGGAGGKGFVYTTFSLGHEGQVVLNGIPTSALDATDFIFSV